MVKGIFVSVLLFMMVGCASTKQISTPVEVLVPVPVAAPQPPEDAFDLPELPIHTLTEKSSDEDVVKAYAASIKILQGFILKIQKYLEIYRKD